MSELDAYGLAEEGVLEVAMELAPELFAALAIASRLEASRFPLESDADLESVLATVGNREGAFESAAVRITPADAKDRFPKEFLPVLDRFDLIRKIYMAIVIAHEAESRTRLEAVRAGESLGASHPLDLEVL